MAERKPPALTRFRRLIFGRRSSKSDGIISSFAGAARVSAGGSLAPAAGPFDEPPAEAAILEGDIPWELRDEQE